MLNPNKTTRAAEDLMVSDSGVFDMAPKMLRPPSSPRPSPVSARFKSLEDSRLKMNGREMVFRCRGCMQS